MGSTNTLSAKGLSLRFDILHLFFWLNNHFLQLSLYESYAKGENCHFLNPDG